MTQYETVVRKLLPLKASGEDYFLSIYFPTPNQDFEKIIKDLTSAVKKTFLSYPGLKRKKDLCHYLTQTLQGKIRLLKDFRRGLAIFVGFNRGQKQIKNFTLLLLSRTPTQEISIGKIFNLDQLVWLNHTPVEGLILNLRRRRCNIYILEKDHLRPVKERSNRFLKPDSREKLSRTQQNQKFVEDIKKSLRKRAKLEPPIDYFIVFHSKTFSDLTEELVQRVKRDNPQIIPVLVDKSIRGSEDIKRQTLDHLKVHQKQHQTQILEEIQSQHIPFIEGWDKVIEANKEDRIKTLFVEDGAVKSGYLLKRGAVFTRPVKGSKQVGNIAPWIARSVSQQGRKVTVLRSHFRGRPPWSPISAQLRY